MNGSVLISTRPKWCEEMASGKKTIEVRKTKPNLQTPFNVYIYETYDKEYADMGVCWEAGHTFEHGCKKVIGEFICDEITPLFNVATTSWNLLAGNIHEYAKGLVKMARLTEEEMHSYANGKNCYAWHISQLKIYDKPKELGEFYLQCEEYGKTGTIDTPKKCKKCRYQYTWGLASKCRVDGKLPITRPPQSWCYVEELR